jgi:hypothetical protein
MENATFLQAYLITLVACMIITFGLIFILRNGLRKFFASICQDTELADFFLKLTNLVIFFGGAGAALRSDYNASKEANWLTLTWNVADQLNNALTIFFQILLALVVVFLILYLVARKKNNP